jgi:hypothetical protein
MAGLGREAPLRSRGGAAQEEAAGVRPRWRWAVLLGSENRGFDWQNISKYFNMMNKNRKKIGY